MTRLIDTDKIVFYTPRMSDGDGLFVKWMKEILSNAPTVDAVSVIRCKDCKWYGKIGCAVNIVDESDKPKENDYCSWAERKEE